MIPVYTSGRLLDIARKASSREPADPDSSLVATLFSAFGAEAWINELLYRVRTSRPEECVGNLAQLQPLIRAARLEERATGTITKYDVIGASLALETWDRGVQPFQDFDLLLEVRNFIVHQKPEATFIDVYQDADARFMLVQPKLGGIAERLVSRGIVDRPLTSALTPALALVQRSEVGIWAYAASCQFIVSMVRLLPPGGWWKLATLGLEDVVTPYFKPGEL
jgi:hypothetical protein